MSAPPVAPTAASADAARRLEKQLYRQLKATSEGYGLLAPGDRVMVAMSGGKDSYVLFTTC
jgi:tRNA 2-thiocytidine biosynthesis protein TtcA